MADLAVEAIFIACAWLLATHRAQADQEPGEQENAAHGRDWIRCDFVCATIDKMSDSSMLLVIS